MGARERGREGASDGFCLTELTVWTSNHDCAGWSVVVKLVVSSEGDLPWVACDPDCEFTELFYAVNACSVEEIEHLIVVTILHQFVKA